MIIPSRTLCGLADTRVLSLKVPGSISSVLDTIYLGKIASSATRDHLRPVGKPAPPQPRRPELRTICLTSRGVCFPEDIRQGLITAALTIVRQSDRLTGLIIFQEYQFGHSDYRSGTGVSCPVLSFFRI